MYRRLLDHPFISSRYFFPRDDAVAHNFVVESGDVQLACHRRAPDPAAPTLLHFHGNGEVVGDWVDSLGDALLARGLNVCFAEYRGYGSSTGWPALAAMLDDALAIADALEVPPGKLLVYGRSVGSLYALQVASRRPEVGLIVESGIADVLQRIALRVSPEEIGATQQEMKDAMAALFDHRAKVKACTGKILVMHAENDHLVPIDHAQSLAAWAGQKGRLVSFSRGDHNTIYAYNSQAIIDEVARFAGVTG